MAAQQPETPSLTEKMLGAVKLFFSKPAEQSVAVPEQSGTGRRKLYMALIAVPLALLATLFFFPKKHVEESPVPPVETRQSVVPAETAVQAKPVEDKSPPAKSTPVVATQSKAASEKVTPKPVQNKPQSQVATQTKHKNDASVKEPVVAEEAQPQVKTPAPAVKKSGPANPFFPDWPGVGADSAKEGFVVITCKEGTQVFIDGAPKGKIASGPLTISVKPGKHRLDITHAKFGFYTEVFDTDQGKTDHIKPKICN
jgi:hypothetical protein